jgi:16S rRNA (cytidine1402-2'-O)-methyltransferase
MTRGKLFLIPNVIAENTQATVIPAHIRLALPDIRYFLAEDVRTARRFLSSLKIYESIEPLTFEVLNKDSSADAVRVLTTWTDAGHHVGIISESGCPGVADPGALAVQYAHQHAIQVVPLVGPSSVLMALMASGLNGQRFAFHGYLPIDNRELVLTIRDLERESRQKDQTQIIIETPYRNNSVVKALLQTLHENSSLTIAVDITGSNESITTRKVSAWRQIKPDLPKMPAVFLFLAT